MNDSIPTDTPFKNRIRQFIAAWRERSLVFGEFVPLAVAVMVGLVTGLWSVLLIESIDVITEFSTDFRAHYATLGSLAILISAGIGTGIIIQYIAPEAQGGGVPDVMESIALKRGRIRRRVAGIKTIASAFTIGTGGSVGREGPVVQIGASIGSAFGRIIRLSDENVSILAASGAAGGISAVFNAPIAGSMFALEIILGRFTKRNLEAVIIAAISANVVSRPLLGAAPAFAVPAYPLDSALEIPAYVMLGILCAFGAILFIRALHIVEHRFEHWNVPMSVRMATGMGLTGLVAILAPEVLGSGLEFIGEAIANNIDLSLSFIVALFFLKMLATLLTLGSGNAGGDLAPTLFLGATIGSLIGRAGNELAPDIVVNPGAFALVGMASMFAGAARAPITAIILVLEMSNDYRLIVPLMLGVVVSTVLSDLMQTDSIYTLKLSLRGIRLQRGQDVDLLQSVSVEDVMDLDYETINPDMTLIDLMVRLNQSHHHGFPIIDEHNHLVGIVTLTDVERAQAEQIPFDTTVRTFGTTRNLQTVYPDDPMYLALRRMTVYDIGRLPVVAPGTSDHYIGMIRREGILRAYDIGLTRKSFELHRDERFRLRNIQDAAFLEINVGPDAPMIGKPLADFPYSNDCLLLSIRRHGETIIAHGDTMIEANDLIVAYADNKHHQAVLEQFGALPPEPEPRHSRLRI